MEPNPEREYLCNVILNIAQDLIDGGHLLIDAGGNSGLAFGGRHETHGRVLMILYTGDAAEMLYQHANESGAWTHLPQTTENPNATD